MLEQKDVSVRCRKCGNMVPSLLLKMDVDAQMMVCPTCLKGLKAMQESAPERAQEPQKKQILPRQGLSSARGVQATAEARMKMKCTNCGYAFNAIPSQRYPRNCPYCSKPVNF